MSLNLPHFIQEHLAFVGDIQLSRRHRSTIALLRNLQLYELQHKQILSSIDLQKTVLRNVQHKIESVSSVLDGIQIEGNDLLGNSIRCSNVPVGEIILGKYVYQNRNLKIVYIILKCWSSLVIIKKNPEGFTLEKEYEDVETFEIIKVGNYGCELEISFLDSARNVVTNFQKKPHIGKSTVTSNKKAEEMLKMKQSELLVHKTITKKEFLKFRNLNVFGNNFLRSPQLDEMMILSKCSDAWLKVNANDNIVIGVPLVNNCSSRLTTLKKFRGLLQCPGRGDLNYSFALYQQSTTYSTMEDIRGAFESEHSSSFDWSQCDDLFLRPETFYVLIFKINIKELVEFHALEFLLFVSYDVVLGDKIFSQKCFLADLSFRDIFANDSHKINFYPSHMQRDMLSVISTSHQLEFSLKYNQDDVSFKEYLCSGMDFHLVSLPESPSETMHVDGCDEEIEVKTGPVFFYNNNPNSLWHGTLIAITNTTDDCSVVKIFTKTQEKSIVFLRFLDIEMRLRCGINEICYDCRNLCTKLVQFENLLREECKAYLEFFSNKCEGNVRNVQSSYQDICLMELNTDLWLKKLKS